MRGMYDLSAEDWALEMGAEELGETKNENN